MFMFRPRKLFASFTIASLLLLVSCRKDPSAPETPAIPGTVLKLTVKPTWHAASFDKNTIYTAAGDQRIHVSLVKFYLSPMELSGENGTTQLMDADLFDVTNGPQSRVLSVPIGTYYTLNLGLGLPPALNHRDIATIPPNAPTGNNSGMYLSWATQYRFLLFEGHFDSIPDGPGEPPYAFSLHTGLDTCYRTRAIPINLTATSGDTARLTINVDIARFFTNGNEVLQLSQGAMWHGEVDQLGLGLKAADLQVASLSVE